MPYFGRVTWCLVVLPTHAGEPGTVLKRLSRKVVTCGVRPAEWFHLGVKNSRRS